jgi:hypothetical protein
MWRKCSRHTNQPRKGSRQAIVKNPMTARDAANVIGPVSATAILIAGSDEDQNNDRNSNCLSQRRHHAKHHANPQRWSDHLPDMRKITPFALDDRKDNAKKAQKHGKQGLKTNYLVKE